MARFHRLCARRCRDRQWPTSPPRGDGHDSVGTAVEHLARTAVGGMFAVRVDVDETGTGGASKAAPRLPGNGTLSALPQEISTSSSVGLEGCRKIRNQLLEIDAFFVRERVYGPVVDAYRTNSIRHAVGVATTVVEGERDDVAKDLSRVWRDGRVYIKRKCLSHAAETVQRISRDYTVRRGLRRRHSACKIALLS